jgi:hypothetical protein
LPFEGHDRPTRKIINYTVPYAGYVGVPVVLYSLEPSGGHNVVAITSKSNHDEELPIPPASNRHAADYALRVPVTNDLP